MSINLSVPRNEAIELKPRITVVGVGGAGGNAVNNMIAANLEGVDFVVANTDAQALALSQTDRRVQLGSSLTQGLGAGSKPEIGRAAAEETIEDINEQLKGSHMVFIAAGMGGGTGTGAAPVIARAARDMGVLTVGVVTKPFQFEGMHRQRLAEKGIEELEQYVDTLIIIPNQNLFRIANEKTTFADAFKMADDVLYSGVRGVTDLMVMPGLINLDFADVRSVMSEMGKAMMGTGEAEGERRALDAAEAAISNPLLDDSSMAGANGVLINITGGLDMTLFEVDEAANRIRSEVDDDAYIIFGSTFDETLNGKIRVSVVATGIDSEHVVRAEPEVLPVHVQALTHTEVSESQPEPASTVAEILRVNADEPIAGSGDLPVLVTTDLATDDLVEEALRPDMKAVEETGKDRAAPVAMPSALNEDAFIPPAPVAEETIEEVKIDPMAEAALLNGAASAAPTKAKGLSLFARVTGGAKDKVSMFGHAKAGREASVQQASVAVSTPTSALRSQGSVAIEPTLGGLEPEERLQPSSAEDDLLDIPAFLRRQAN